MILGATLELKGTFSEYSAKPEAFEVFVLGDSFEMFVSNKSSPPIPELIKN